MNNQPIWLVTQTVKNLPAITRKGKENRDNIEWRDMVRKILCYEKYNYHNL